MKNDLKTSRDNFIAHVAALAAVSKNAEIQQLHNQLKNGQLKLADMSIYNTKNVSGMKTIRVFESSDKRDDALCSLDSATLEKNQYFMVNSITMLGHVYAAGDVDPGNPTASPAVASTDPATLTPGDAFERKALMLGNYRSLGGSASGQSALAIIANGEMLVRSKRKTHIDQFPLSRFVQDGNYSAETGTLTLENPFLLLSQDVIELELELGRVAAAGTLLRVMLNGTGTVMV